MAVTSEEGPGRLAASGTEAKSAGSETCSGSVRFGIRSIEGEPVAEGAISSTDVGVTAGDSSVESAGVETSALAIVGGDGCEAAGVEMTGIFAQGA